MGAYFTRDNLRSIMSRKITVERLPTVDVNVLNKNGAFNGSASDWVMRFPFLGLRTSLNNLSNPAYRQKCLELRPKFEEMARKKGVTLAHIFAATEKPVKIYKHPEPRQRYSSRSKKPAYREGSKGTWPSLVATPVEEAPED